MTTAPIEMPISDRPWVRRVLRPPVTTGTVSGVTSVIVQLGACLVLGWLVGGTDHTAPHWYYLPIAFAALRFGVSGAFLTALAAAVLAGPLTAADVGAGTIQPLGDQLAQLVAFVVVGVGLALVVERSATAARRDASSFDVNTRVLDAIENGDLTIEYQPLWRVDEDGEHLIGVEALARWVDPVEGTMPPGAFVPVLERSDRLDEFGTWTLNDVCARLAEWERTALSPGRSFHVAVNVSSVQLDRGFAELVATTLARHGVPASRLVLELTERTLLEDLATAVPVLDDIRALGVRLAIDDFGTGFSSLAYLRELEVDIVKLDRAFIGRLGAADPAGDDTDATIVAAIVALGRDLGKEVLVEGVESRAQLDRLRTLGASTFQGRILGGPVGPSTVASLLGAGGSAPEDRPPSSSGPRPPGRRRRVADWLSRDIVPQHPVEHSTSTYQAQTILVAMFYAGSLLTMVIALLTDVDNRPGALALGTTGLVSAMIVHRHRGRIATWMLHVLLLAGLATIATVVAADPVPTTMVAGSAFLIWVTIYAGAFFELRDAVAHGVLTGLAFAAVLRANPVDNSPAVWLLVMGTAGVAGFVVGWFARQLRRLAATDPLTGLPNRQAFESRLVAEIDRAERSNTSLALALVDLDDFKAINDADGHHAGDRVLATLPTQWRQELRTHDLLARYGGDEFIVLLPDCPLDDAEDVLTRMSNAGRPSCSVGVATLAWGEDAASLVTRADAALYEAKAQHSIVRADRSVPSELAVGGSPRQHHPAGHAGR